jgi:hypothetical protein
MFAPLFMVEMKKPGLVLSSSFYSVFPANLKTVLTVFFKKIIPGPWLNAIAIAPAIDGMLYGRRIA